MAVNDPAWAALLPVPPWPAVPLFDNSSLCPLPKVPLLALGNKNAFS